MPNLAAGGPNLHVDRQVAANSVRDEQLTAGLLLAHELGRLLLPRPD